MSAEVPTVEVPEVTISSEDQQQVACQPPPIGQDTAAPEAVAVEAIQLRISEDGDLEKSTTTVITTTTVSRDS